MISYKSDVLERQSLSEVKMAEALQSVKVCVKRLWNTLKTTFLNVKLQRLWKSHHLQCITSSKDSEKLEKSLCVRDKAEDLCWMPVVFGPSDDTASLIGMILSLTLLNGPGILPETTVVNTIRRAICRCQLKLYHAKRKPYVNMVQKRRCVLWAKAHLKWTVSKWKSVLWSDESKFDILVGNHGRRVLRAKEEGDLPACHQRTVQKPASLMVWGCICAYGMGSLHVLEGTMNAERYIKGFRAIYAPLQTTSISAGQCKTTYCSYYNSMAS